MKKILFKPTFVNTHNVRRFSTMMDALDMMVDEGCLAVIWSEAGRGKTRTAQRWHAASRGSVYLRMVKAWRKSELGFLRALCRELGDKFPPGRIVACFESIIDKLVSDPVPIFLDELEKLPGFFLEIVRDISDLTTAPFILIGEEEILPYMRRNKRVWSRTFQTLEFKPITASEIISYTSQATDLELTSPKVAEIYFASSNGDFRIIKRDLLETMKMAYGKGTRKIDEKLAKTAVKAGLKG